MEAKLTFLFPPTSSSNKYNAVAYHNDVNLVQMTLAVPFAKQQPHLVSNLFYLLMNELPSYELLSALGVQRKEIPFANAEEVRVRNNLKSFKEMCIVRIDIKEGVVELGSSSSKSIFGGFINDEKLPDVQEVSNGTNNTTSNTSNNINDDNDHVGNIGRQMRMLRAGTLLCGNIGIVNSNGSRYYLLLRDFNVKTNHNGNNNNNKNNNKQKDEDDNDNNPFSSCIPLGFVTSGLKMFSDAVARVPVQPRVLLPLKKVELVESEIDFTQNFTQSSINCNIGVNISDTMQPKKTSEANARPSVDKRSKHMKRARSDEDEDETEQNTNGKNTINAKTNLYSQSTNEFFHFSARFPTKHLSQLSNVLEQQRKRRRLDASAEIEIDSATSGNGSIDKTIHHNMAILPPLSSEVASAAEASMKRLVGDKSNEQGNKFDYFKVQSNVLMNDLMQIEQTQGQRQRRHAKRNAKQSRIAAARHDANKRSDGGASMASSKVTSDVAKVVKGKKLLNKRY